VLTGGATMTPAPHPLFRVRTKPSHILNGIQAHLVWIDYWNGKKWVDSQCNFPMQSIPDWVVIELEKQLSASHSSESQKGRDGEKVEPSSASSDVLEEMENPDMICENFMQLSCVIPANCYNCVRRNGYPSYLFGEEQCANFKKTRLVERNGDDKP